MNPGGRTSAMVVAGVMSGTSADGVDIALCHIRRSARGEPLLRLHGHRHFPYSARLRGAVLVAMEGNQASAAQFSRLHWRLGSVYADSVARAAQELGVKVSLVGCHGQTIYHQARPEQFLGQRVRATWQIGEAAVIAERLRCPVVSDFRPADLAAGGQGAPLVPMLDWTLFRSVRRSRVLLNLGGIANVTALPQSCNADRVLAFDTGPANMVIDGCMRRLLGKTMDRAGVVARRGRVQENVVRSLLALPYFSARPPKSCGREQFGEAFCTRLIKLCRAAGATAADTVATATALTVASVVAAHRQFVEPHLGASRTEYLVAGGGAKNHTLMRSLAEGFASSHVRLRSMEELGVGVEAKEAAAFALLAWLTWHRAPGNLPAATGATRLVVLGKVSLP